MAKVEIYTSPNCPSCVRAKALFERKGVAYTEFRIDRDNARREEMLTRTDGRRTTPQIFVDDHLIGGFDELWELEQQKKLGRLL